MSAVAALREPDAVLEPGGEVTAEISVLNTGTIVDQFEIDVIGAPAAWAYVEPSVMSLFPNTQQVATIRFRPPLSHEVPPGPTPFAVRVVPTNSPDHCVTEEGMLVLAPFKDVAVEMIPTAVEGRIRAKAHLAVDSRGNFPFTVLIQASDPAAALVIRARPATLDLRPNQASFAQIYLVPRRRHLKGGVKQHRFKVLVDDAGTTIASIDGQMSQPPLLPKWLIALLILLIALLVWLLILRPVIKDTASSAANSAVAGQTQANKNLAAATKAETKAAALQAALAKAQSALVAQKAAEAAKVAAALQKATASSLAALKKSVSSLAATTTTTTAPIQTVNYSPSLEAIIAPGTTDSATWTVPAKDTYAATDFVLDTLNSGETGEVLVQLLTTGSQPQTLFEMNLTQLSAVPAYDVRLQTPVTVDAGQELALTVECDPDQAACQVGALISGGLTQPTPKTTTTTTVASSASSSSTTTTAATTTTTAGTTTTSTTTTIPFSGSPNNGAAKRNASAGWKNLS
jgi:hypothetical protein